MIRKPCAQPGCTTLIPQGQRHCRAHHRTYGYSTTHWRNTRNARLNIDGHRCTLRLTGCTTTATTVHLDPSLAGDHSQATLSNTRSACHHCHGLVDAPRANVAA